MSDCAALGQVPFFDNCLSKTVFTAIFLISIILAGISFILVIGLLIITCRKRGRRGSPSISINGSESDADEDDEESVIDRHQPVKQAVLKKIVQTVPPATPSRPQQLQPPAQSPHLKQVVTSRVPQKHDAPSANQNNLAPYTNSVPINHSPQQININQRQPQTYNMTPRESQQPFSTHIPRTAQQQQQQQQQPQPSRKSNNNYSAENEIVDDDFDVTAAKF